MAKHTRAGEAGYKAVQDRQRESQAEKAARARLVAEAHKRERDRAIRAAERWRRAEIGLDPNH